jgi:hypothetical protein
MVITGDPSSELQQYLHLPGHPSVGMIMMWKGFFITLFSPHYGIFVFIRQGNREKYRKSTGMWMPDMKRVKKNEIR